MHNSMMQFALGVTLRGCSFMESSILNIQPNVNTISPRAQVHRKPNFLRLFEVWAQGRDGSTIMENDNIETLVVKLLCGMNLFSDLQICRRKHSVGIFMECLYSLLGGRCPNNQFGKRSISAIFSETENKSHFNFQRT